MSVAEQLDLTTDGGPLQQAAASWPAWTVQRSALVGAPALAELRPWLRSRDPATVDAALHDLAWLASPRGGDSIPAAGVLAWVLLPGACTLAQRLRTLTPRIDAVVAAQLWLEVRSFAWERRRKVAANIIADTRAGVLRECGARGQVERFDRAWSRAEPRGELINLHPTTASDNTAAELHELLDWACATHVISETDRTLLYHLACVADLEAGGRVRRGRGGLMANSVSATVAAERGVSAITVRRHARRALANLTAACATARTAA